MWQTAGARGKEDLKECTGALLRLCPAERHLGRSGGCMRVHPNKAACGGAAAVEVG
eukprot:CAMPEP_0197902516 /NCGR_PEP_ID=MMETSP1439-20131203/53662_1 /TAXON_ID=66791 /ORGANISM="Gonyaulax spinifera, Strain CCMP409" /LENGTH=55 /DNA_ID=CAMNT_0043523551 /DNA_START=195 /DNA_END=359 /DNA_ORIENTATION=-